MSQLGPAGRPPAGLHRNAVEFPGATWTSFDRYTRYGALARALRANLGPGCHRVVDVGDAAGYLGAFDPGLDVVGIDLVPTPDPLPGAVRLAGDGTRLPFPDAAFDAAVSSDALEHVPPHARVAFLTEMARVARELVVVAAPFDTPGVAGAEELVRRYALMATGRPQEQLEEHRAHGLPGLGSAQAALRDAGLEVATVPNGNLHDWVAMMLLKHQLVARPALGPLADGYDVAYNLLFPVRERAEPAYRHVLVARRGASPELGAPPSSPEARPDGVPGLLATFAAANASEAVRQDVEPRLVALQARVDELAASAGATEKATASALAHAQALAAAVEQLGAVAARVEGKVDRITEALRHPVRTAGRRFRHWRPG